jgi:hypothetical protein
MSPLLELLVRLRGKHVRLRYCERGCDCERHLAQSGLLLRVEVDHVVLRHDATEDDAIPLYSIEGVERILEPWQATA